MKRHIFSTAIVIAALAMTLRDTAFAAENPRSVAPTSEEPARSSVGTATISSGTVYGVARRLTLQQCFDLADAKNLEIRVASSKLPLAEAAIVIAKAIPNPNFNLTYGWGPAWDYIVAGNNQQFGFSEEIQVAGKRSKKTNVANASYLQTALQVEAVRFDVHNRVRRAYASLAASTSYDKLLRYQRDITVKLANVSGDNQPENAGVPSELRGKLITYQFEVQLNNARSRLVQDSAQLIELLGETPLHEEIIGVEDIDVFSLHAERNKIIPSPERGLPELQSLLPTAWAQRTDLKAAIQQAYVNRKSLTLAKSQRIPNPTVGANFLFSSYNRSQPQDFDPDGSGIFGDPNNRVPAQPAFLLTLSTETPLYYQYQGQIAQAKAAWEYQLKQNDVQRAQIANDIVVAYESLLVARSTIEKFQTDLLPEALKVAQLSQKGYQVGQSNLATAVLAQHQYQQLRAGYFNSVVAYQNAWADLEKAVGVPLKL